MRLKLTDEAAEIIRKYAEENGISYYNEAASQIILLFDEMETRRKAGGVLKLQDNKVEMVGAGSATYVKGAVICD